MKLDSDCGCSETSNFLNFDSINIAKIIQKARQKVTQTSFKKKKEQEEEKMYYEFNT